MKKIGIVTFQRAMNYGALLQMYALNKYIADSFETCSVDIIDYYSGLCVNESKMYKSKERNLFILLLKRFNYLLKKHRFHSFVKARFNMSKMVTAVNIESISKDYDIMISGSDQVWNPDITGGDPNYLLNFSNTPTKMSYAASIGKNELPNEYVKPYKDCLAEFRHISVREYSAKKIVDELLEKDVAVVNVDPTLLLSSQQWNLLARKTIKGRYLFVYQVKYSALLLEKAKKFAESKGLKVLYVGPFSKTKGVHYIPAPSVEKILSLFKNAEYVFTNSFHGTVFSIQFNKLFFVDLMFSDGRNDRITDLLSICNLTTRTNLNFIDTTPDWNSVREELDEERERSYNYFCKAFEELS